MKIYGLDFYIALSGASYFVFSINGTQMRQATGEEVTLWNRLLSATDNGPG